MEHNLEKLAELYHKMGIPQFVPPLLKKIFDHSVLDYHVYSSKVRIRATRECTIRLHLKHPTTITVLGGYRNTYLVEGEREVLQQSKIIYLAGFGNSVPENIEVVIEGGVRNW